MKWIQQDLEKYEQAKEYVDTILLPVIPFQMDQDKESKKYAYQHEVMKIFANEIERELSGRVMLAPNYVYLKTTEKEKEVERIEAWIQNIEENPFEHVFYLTFDSSWKKNEKNLNGHLLWIPAPGSMDIQSQEMQNFVRSQIEQISEVIRSLW